MSEELKIMEEKYMLIEFNSLNKIAKEALDMLGEEESKSIRDEIGEMLYQIALYEDRNDTLPIKDFLISVESITAQFILNPKRKGNILGVDAYISYENIVAAYLNAIKENNSKMANKIEPFLKNRTFGFTANLNIQDEYDLIKYIKENGDLKAFLEDRKVVRRIRRVFFAISGEYDEYVLYENGEVSIKTLNKTRSFKKA
ncbi:MAG: hypothetical protein HFE04_02360 [Bacilli bacterium]|nr:hypothetical protein [Bacilli bacterium]